MTHLRYSWKPENWHFCWISLFFLSQSLSLFLSVLPFDYVALFLWTPHPSFLKGPFSQNLPTFFFTPLTLSHTKLHFLITCLLIFRNRETTNGEKDKKNKKQKKDLQKNSWNVAKVITNWTQFVLQLKLFYPCFNPFIYILKDNLKQCGIDAKSREELVKSRRE